MVIHIDSHNINNDMYANGYTIIRNLTDQFNYNGYNSVIPSSYRINDHYVMDFKSYNCHMHNHK